MPQRLPYEESCRVLQKQQVIEFADIPSMPRNPPRYNDETAGVSFFRVMVADAKLDHLTLPRTFFGRSEISGTSFKNTDLSESTANWNDFMDVDFSFADLSLSDFRACVFRCVRFRRARLVAADFRYCGFTDCDFSDADLTDAKMTVKAGKSLRLSDEQRTVIDWQTDDGEEPEGG